MHFVTTWSWTLSSYCNCSATATILLSNLKWKTADSDCDTNRVESKQRLSVYIDPPNPEKHTDGSLQNIVTGEIAPASFRGCRNDAGAW